jgi:hypothetical protein
VPDEELIDHFTAVTGPVPGFVAYCAECMVQYALKHGIDPVIHMPKAICHARQPFDPHDHSNPIIACA